MTLEEIKDLKDKIYEIEGLLELAQMREDKIPELEPLILSRINALREDNIPEETEKTAGDMEDETSEEESSVTYGEPEGVLTELFEDNETVSVSREAEDLETSKIKEPAPHSAKPAFTLNDRFRFRRELFSNSDAEYSSAMDLIASMDSYEEAEEYFLDELGWSLENPEVKDFMDIIRKYFA